MKCIKNNKFFIPCYFLVSKEPLGVLPSSLSIVAPWDDNIELPFIRRHAVLDLQDDSDGVPC